MDTLAFDLSATVRCVRHPAVASPPCMRRSGHGLEYQDHRGRGPDRPRSQEPLAGAARFRAERERTAAGAVHVGAHVLRLVDPHLARTRCGRSPSSSRAISCSAHRIPAIVSIVVAAVIVLFVGHALLALRKFPAQLPPVRDLPRTHARDAARGHDAVVLAGRSPASRCSSSPPCTCT